jgi:hypothetical protein
MLKLAAAAAAIKATDRQDGMRISGSEKIIEIHEP